MLFRSAPPRPVPPRPAPPRPFLSHGVSLNAEESLNVEAHTEVLHTNGAELRNTCCKCVEHVERPLVFKPVHRARPTT